MENVIKSDIFFFITSIAVVLLAALAGIALVYAIRILHDVREVSSKVKAESDEILKDVREARHFAKREGVRLASLAGFIGSFFKGKAKARKAKKQEDDNE